MTRQSNIRRDDEESPQGAMISRVETRTGAQHRCYYTTRPPLFLCACADVLQVEVHCIGLEGFCVFLPRGDELFWDGRLLEISGLVADTDVHLT